MKSPEQAIAPANGELGESFSDVSQAMLMELSQTIAQANLSIPQFLLLTELYNRDLTMSEISKILQTSNAAVTGLADRLENLKLVRRTRSEEDRRVVKVSITKAGRVLIGRIQKAFTPHREEIPQTLGILKRLILPA